MSSNEDPVQAKKKYQSLKRRHKLTLFNPGGHITQLVNYLPAMQETWLQFLGQEDPLEKEMENYSSILAWKIPWMEEPGSLHSMGSQRVGHD